MVFISQGYQVFAQDSRVTAWAEAAAEVAREVTQAQAQREMWLRHRGTWFVGVDALPNAVDGAIDGIAFHGPWERLIERPETWHPAQVSAVYEGYPKQDVDESDASHRFRIKRCAAHVDGLLLEAGRRYLREPHRFILGLPLGRSDASPLVIWPKSHIMIRDALRAAVGAGDPLSVDLTEAYKSARARVFEAIEPVEIHMTLGQSVVLHRHMLHGVAPWKDTDSAPPEGRMVAYFRPQFSSAAEWLGAP